MRRRRFLPSMSLLCAFDAVMRTGSTAAAARELSLSQSSVSRLVQSLEAQLSTPLFRRHKQKLQPTEAAHAYAREIAQALELIHQSSRRVAIRPQGDSLSIAILPAFGTHWLAPRLSRFTADHPHIRFNLATRLNRVDFAAEGFDAAIHFGIDDGRDADRLRLFDERLIACVAPERLAAAARAGMATVHSIPLLQLETRPQAWRRWFGANGGERPEPGGMLFDQFATMTQAAIAGLGMALLPDYLAEGEIGEGRLAAVPDTLPVWHGTYWLVWPPEQGDNPALLLFRDWIGAAAANYQRDQRRHAG